MSKNLIARRRTRQLENLTKEKLPSSLLSAEFQMSKVEPSEGVKNTPAWLPVYLSINWTANNVIYVCVNVFSAQKVHQGQEILREDC